MRADIDVVGNKLDDVSEIEAQVLEHSFDALERDVDLVLRVFGNRPVRTQTDLARDE